MRNIIKYAILAFLVYVFIKHVLLKLIVFATTGILIIAGVMCIIWLTSKPKESLK